MTSLFATHLRTNGDWIRHLHAVCVREEKNVAGILRCVDSCFSSLTISSRVEIFLYRPWWTLIIIHFFSYRILLVVHQSVSSKLYLRKWSFNLHENRKYLRWNVDHCSNQFTRKWSVGQCIVHTVNIFRHSNFVFRNIYNGVVVLHRPMCFEFYMEKWIMQISQHLNIWITSITLVWHVVNRPNHYLMMKMKNSM